MNIPMTFMTWRNSFAMLFALAAFCAVAAACAPRLGDRTPTPPGGISPTATLIPSLTLQPPTQQGGDSPVSTLALPSIATVAERVEPAVVAITTERVTLDFFFRERVVQGGQGSGVIFDASGLIITNNHVVAGATRVQITLVDGRVFEGEVVGVDPPTDLAVVRIDADDLPVAELGTTHDLRVGDWVIAIGNALGDGISVTQGIVSAMERSLFIPGSCELESLIQTDAAINPGNSGGPLISLDGRVIGINTAIAQNAEGVGFAISVDQARPIVSYLADRGRVPGEPWIGVQPGEVTPAVAQQFGLAVTAGIIINPVQGGPADQARMRLGDVITHIDEVRMRTRADLGTAITAHEVGEEVTLSVDRFGQKSEIRMQLGEKPRLCT